MTTNIIRCSEQHAVATKCRNASNGTSQARTRPMRSALSNLNQTPKREVVKSAPHPHLHPHFRHFGDITSPLSNPARSRAKPQRRTAKLPLFHPSSLYIPNHRPKWPSESLSASDSLITPPPTGGGSSRLPEASWSSTT